MNNKRGISPIIATVLVILLTVTSVAVIAGFIVPFVRDNLDSSTECLAYRDYLEFDETFGFNCQNETGLYVSVRKGFPLQGEEQELNEFRLVFQGDSDSSSVAVRDGETSSEIITYGSSVLEVPAGGEVRTYVYSGGGSFKSMEVYPVLDSGRVCDLSDTINVRASC